MAYDSNKDKAIKVFTYEYEGGSLLFAVMAYNGGPRKLQMTRTYEKKDGEIGYVKVGRLTENELIFLGHHLEEILKTMKGEET